MKKNFLILILLAALVGGAFSYIYTHKDKMSEQVAGVNAEDLSQEERDKLIAQNIDKYQPKGDHSNTSGPTVAAKTAIVVDQKTNEIIYAKNIDRALPPASVIKMLTLSVALELHDPDDLIEISQHASEQISNKINMKAGEKIKLSDLLYGLMMISANDAAYAIADDTEGGFDRFVELANDKVALLGLKNTVMKNPAGLDDPEQTSSAFDLATITRYALLEHPDVIKYAGKTTEHSVQMTDHNEPHWWFGHLSRMLTAYKPMIAAKTGFTDAAGNTYIGIAEKNGRRLVMVMLGSDVAHANDDVQSLLDYGFTQSK